MKPACNLAINFAVRLWINSLTVLQNS